MSSLAATFELLRRAERATPAVRAWPALFTFVPVAALAADQGGYFPTSWGWAAIAFVWVAVVALVLRTPIRLGHAQRVLALAWTAFAAWTACSIAWSANVPQTVLEVERVLVYLTAVAALLAIVTPRGRVPMLGGVLCAVGAVALFSLATRLFPNTLRVFSPRVINRLAQPIGYWNGLCAFVAVGMVLAFGFAVRGRSVLVRAASAALVVPLFTTFYFTFSHNGWIALAAGVAVTVALERRRLELLLVVTLLAPLLALDLYFSSRLPGMTRAHTSLAQATRDGHHLAGILVALTVAAAVLVGGVAVAARRVTPPQTLRTGFGIGFAVACAVALALAFSRYGGPSTLAHDAWRSFKTPPSQAEDLNRRLLTLSGDGRYDYWRIALDDAGEHPILGSGAGTYERYYLRHAPADISRVRDAHSLYVETLAELGPIGLALLLVALLTPFAVVATRRRGPLTAAAAGAYAVLLVHAASDWDWELPAVMLTGIVCAVVLVGGPRGRNRRRPVPLPARAAGLAALAAAGLFALVGLVGNEALARSTSALDGGRLTAAATQARKAAWWMPWAAAPWDTLGNAQLQAGDASAARTSFRRALSIDDGDWQVWADLARASTGAQYRQAAARSLSLYPRSGLDAAAPAGLPGKP